MDPQQLDRQIEEIRALYDILAPQEAFEAHLWWDETEIDTPVLQPATEPLRPDMLDPAYLGQIRLGPEEARVSRRALLTVPRQPAPEEMSDSYMPWEERGRRARLVFDLSPVLFEQVKYGVERWRAARVTRNHRFAPFPLSQRIALREGAPARRTDIAPAILIGFHFLEVGGAEKLAFDTVNWALEAGLRVFVIANRPGLQRAAHKLPQDPRVRFLRSDQYIPRGQTQTFLRNLVARENIVLTHNHHCNVLYEALPALKVHFPDMVHIDSTHIVEYADGGYPRVSGVWSDYIDMHHVISTDLITAYKAHFRNPGKLKLGRLLDPQTRAATPAPVRIGAGQKTCRVTFVGRMVHQKRPILAVAIMRRLARWGRRAGIAFEFDLIGEGPYAEAVAYLVRKYGLQAQTTLHAADADVPAILRASDVMLLPSANEGLALVCYEAIEAGAVPLATDVGGQREIVPDDLLVHPAPYRTISQSVAVIKRLLKDPAFAPRVGAEMQARFDALRAEPLAKDVVMPFYERAAEG